MRVVVGAMRRVVVVSDSAWKNKLRLRKLEGVCRMHTAMDQVSGEKPSHEVPTSIYDQQGLWRISKTPPGTPPSLTRLLLVLASFGSRIAILAQMPIGHSQIAQSQTSFQIVAGQFESFLVSLHCLFEIFGSRRQNARFSSRFVLFVAPISPINRSRHFAAKETKKV